MPIEAFATACVVYSPSWPRSTREPLDRAIDRAAGQRFLGAKYSTVGGHFVSLDELPALTLDSQVQIVSALCRVAGDGDGVSFSCPASSAVPAIRGTGAGTSPVGSRRRWTRLRAG